MGAPIAMIKVERGSLTRGETAMFKTSRGQYQECVIDSPEGKGCYVRTTGSNHKRFARWSELFRVTLSADSAPSPPPTLPSRISYAQPGNQKAPEPDVAQPQPESEPVAAQANQETEMSAIHEVIDAPGGQGRDEDDAGAIPEQAHASELQPLSSWLRWWRETNGLKQGDLAAAAKMAPHRVSIIELAKSLADDDELLGLATALASATRQDEIHWVSRLEAMRAMDVSNGVKSPRCRYTKQQPRRMVSSPKATPSQRPAGGQITVTINGVSVTGAPDDIRKLVGME